MAPAPPNPPPASSGGPGGGAPTGVEVQILDDSGVLRTTMETEHGPDFAAVSATAPYGAFHVTGTRRMPRRDFTDIEPFFEGVGDILLEEIFAQSRQRAA